MELTVRSWLTGTALAAVVSACGGSDVQPSETLAKPVENLQCEPPRVTIRQLDEELATAGVAPRARSCAWDGLGRVTACGAPVVYLRVIEVTQDQTGTARTLGYRSPAEFPNVIPITCPAQ